MSGDSIIKTIHELIQKLREPLYKNSIFLIASTFLGAGTGFIFWIIAARLYSIEDVGLASAAISAMSLINLLSLFGFNVTLVRFIPQMQEKNELINSCITISCISAFVMSLIFLVGLDFWAPSLIFLRENKISFILFILFTTSMSLTTLQRWGFFIGFRKAEYSFIQTVVTFARIGVLPLLIFYGALGIFMSYGVTSILACTFGIFLASKACRYRISFGVNLQIIRNLLRYSFGNYIADIFARNLTYTLPILVVNTLGAEANAYFYIAWAITVLLLMSIESVSMSLLAEGSYNQRELLNTARRALKFIFMFLTPTIIFIFFFGDKILLIFGKEYSIESFEVLRILILASIFYSINIIYVTIKRVEKDIKPVIYVHAFITLFTLSVSYLLMQIIGVLGVGVAFMLANIIVATVTGHRILI